MSVISLVDNAFKPHEIPAFLFPVDKKNQSFTMICGESSDSHYNNCIWFQMDKGPLTIRVVAFQEGDLWSAQCLEYDIATQAASLPDLYYEVERTLRGHVMVAAKLGREPFAGLARAPTKYWAMYGQAALTVQGKRVPFRSQTPNFLQIASDLRIAA